MATLLALETTLKISYSCMPNVKLIINKHNKIILDPLTNTSERTCNCKNKEKCPLQESASPTTSCIKQL